MINILKKYNYDINRIIGIDPYKTEGLNKYILYADTKTVQKYDGKITDNLLNSFISIDDVILYSFEIDKSLLDKTEKIEDFVETKLYEENVINDSEEYIKKYKIVDMLKNPKKVMIETIVIPKYIIFEKFKEIIEKYGYIDYLSFPGLSYEVLYNEKILTPGNDAFIVILENKTFITVYSEGKLIKILTVSNGYKSIFKKISQKLKIKNFDEKIFKKLITEKGFNENFYEENEKKVLENLKQIFFNFGNLIKDQINKNLKKYDMGGYIERFFISSEYGNIPKIDVFLSNIMEIEVKNFEFYDFFNIQKHDINPFLLLGMIETHYAYKKNIFDYNFSEYKRKPNFIYRNSGKFIIGLSAIAIVELIPILILTYNYFNYNKKNNNFEKQISSLNKKITEILSINKKLVKKETKLEKTKNRLQVQIKSKKNLIDAVYNFKFSYIPKSEELLTITKFLNKNHVYVHNITGKNNEIILNVFAKNNKNIVNFAKDLIDNKFKVKTKGIKMDKNFYISNIKVKK